MFIVGIVLNYVGEIIFFLTYSIWAEKGGPLRGPAPPCAVARGRIIELQDYGEFSKRPNTCGGLDRMCPNGAATGRHQRGGSVVVDRILESV